MVRMSAYMYGEYTSIATYSYSRVGRIRCVDAPITLPSPTTCGAQLSTERGTRQTLYSTLPLLSLTPYVQCIVDKKVKFNSVYVKAAIALLSIDLS
jgi:hypothetical protein